MDDTGLIDRLWPDGISDEEQAFLASLSPHQRERLMERLRAIEAATREGADLNAIAGRLPMGRTAFYELRRRWTSERSLRVVAPWGTRTRRPKFGLPAKRSDIAEGGEAEDGDGGTNRPSLPTARRLARERTRALASRPSVLRANFGRNFALDVSGVDIIVKGERGSSWLTCAFLLECASGLILSAGAGSAEASPSLAKVVRNGMTVATELRLDVKEPSFSVVMPEPQDGEMYQWLQNRLRLSEILGEDRLSFTGPRRFGNTLLEVVGDRIDKLMLRPRAGTRSGAPTAKQVANTPSPTAEEIEVLLDVAVRRHNQPIEKRLKRLGLIGNGDPKPLIDLLNRAFPVAPNLSDERR
ncbi:hypothetical protein [Sphingomonas sp. Leaf257]|uniref:hypothetical protein n=1 Tax=Sphingomonas sp. Leaf257 TaxID=1736309 RepID=UPI0006FEC965|nr:hypothetical protein [Sphingomonas sp. Leaf257]KQO58622.1 hypothetical protein ASF14_01415 [Sphingomonas sp. Leaf257]